MTEGMPEQAGGFRKKIAEETGMEEGENSFFQDRSEENMPE